MVISFEAMFFYLSCCRFRPDAGEVEGEQDADEDTLSFKEATDREKKRLAADFVGALASTDDKEDKGTYIGLDSRLLASSKLDI